MALLTADQIFAADDRKYEVVPVPEWGGDVRLRTLSGKERDKFESTLQQRKGNRVKDNMENFRARLVGLCAVDATGGPLFTNTQQINLLGDRSVAALQRLFDKCNEMNGFSEQDIEELTEDFEEAPVAASTSVSQVISGGQ